MIDVKQNPVCVILAIEKESAQAPLYSKFCGIYPAQQGQEKWLFLQCSEATPEGPFLAVKVIQPPPAAPVSLRIPSALVLLISDAPLTEKKVGFLA